MKQLVILALVGIAVLSTAQTPFVSVKNSMTVYEFEAAGLNKLSKEELLSLDQWLNRFMVVSMQRPSPAGVVAGTYVVEASANDETFIINGEVFKARTYCFHINKGDRVKFVDGSANGACSSAKFLNMRTGDVCEAWCE